MHRTRLVPCSKSSCMQHWCAVAWEEAVSKRVLTLKPTTWVFYIQIFRSSVRPRARACVGLYLFQPCRYALKKVKIALRIFTDLMRPSWMRIRIVWWFERHIVKAAHPLKRWNGSHDSLLWKRARWLWRNPGYDLLINGISKKMYYVRRARVCVCWKHKAVSLLSTHPPLDKQFLRPTHLPNTMLARDYRSDWFST